MAPLASFPAAVGNRPEFLILGSMPGGESLRLRQYYAFRRNAFWPIMGELYAFDPGLPYAERLRILGEHRIALWDVLAGCERQGSLDAAIREPVPNDIPSVLREFPGIRKICCNGGAAGKFLRRFFPTLPIPVEILPSTSPAAAGHSYPVKLARWKEALQFRENRSC